MHNPLDLTGNLVLVTGASSGIGRATAIELSRMGARLILTGRRADALEETLAATEKRESHLCSTLDLANLDEIPKWVARVVNRSGAQLDGVVHCAGVVRNLPLRAVSKFNIESVMAINVNSALMLLRAVTAKDVASPAGMSIVFVSSAAALVASPGMATYSASKGALKTLVRSAAKELVTRRIRVNCIMPAYVKTPMLERSIDALTDLKEIERRQCLGLIEPEEVGVMAAYLLSRAARSITGAELLLDGGFTL